MQHIKNISYTFVSIFIFAMSIINVNAATLNVSINSSSSQVVVGNTVTYTVKVSSSELLGSLKYNLSYDTSKLTLVSGTLNAFPVFTGKEKSATYTFKFRAKASGTAKVTFTLHEAIDWNYNNFSFNKSTSKSTTIITQAQLEASYSKNNYLSSLSVSNHSISPAFNKNTLEYSLDVENEITSITINGSKEDSKSSVSGTGNFQLNEGLNKFQVKVTAQNGSTRIYTVNVNRKELTPIVVDVNGTNYNVVRKAEMITSPNSNYEPTTIKINNEDVPAFINNITNTTLVGLKDSEGNISLYILKDDKYTLYTEYKFDGLILTEEIISKIPYNYKEVNLTINEKEIKALQQENDSNYYLIYATNISTGETNFYQYDSKEKTVQLFNSSPYDEINELNEKNKNYVYVIIGLGSLLALTYLIILIKTIKHSDNSKKVVNNKSKKNKKKEIENDNKELINKFEEFEDDDNSNIDGEHIIKNFENEKKNNKKLSEEDLTEDLGYIEKEIEQNIEKSDRIEETVSYKSKKNNFKKKEK